jgi:DNA-binding transcriptional MerR regulator
MRDLVQSGRFAQLARLSRKALRLYAELGLLRPVHVNLETGYRYYSLPQLEEASRIAHLRELGMPLAAIRDALRVWSSPEFTDHLERHRARLHAQAAQVQAALDALDALLRRPHPHYDVALKTVRAQPYLGRRGWCDPDAACDFIESAHHQLAETLKQAVVRSAGPLIARYHAEKDDAWDIEVCLPISERPAMALPKQTLVGELPEGPVAFTVHEGDCGGSYGMQAAYGAVWQWVNEHGYQPVGGPYEVYLFDASNTASGVDYRTELAWMVRGA